MSQFDRYRPVIGLEIHVQLNTKTKAFCNCSADVFDLEPNTAICPVCTGQPGALPVPSQEMYDLGTKLALALNCKINEYTRFDRKNYFYPDLPKGYQISQFFYPLAEYGYLEVNGKKIRIRRIHLEEDAGKLLHSGDSITEADYSLVDMNRCGIPLAEIVTEPDIESPEEARIFMEKLRTLLRYLEVSSGDMEKGAMRCDANISVIDVQTGKQSNKVEVKNMNSFKFVEKALEYEFERIVSLM
ncbi:MAG: Asp-tRNA(Asn)/Glu-tRNA(Gln) amidotransferase subunit GatB, partial [Fervidobacterium nodosum]